MHVEVGSYEAKTKLPELLRGVQAGHRYTITLRGQPIADLLPVQQKKINDAAAAVNRMRAFMRSRKPTPRLDLKALVQAAGGQCDRQA